MKPFLLAAFLSFTFSAFAQKATSSIQQKVSLQLQDISILNKVSATNNSEGVSLQIQSSSQWVMSSNKINKDKRQAEANFYVESVNNPVAQSNSYLSKKSEVALYTVSKI